MTTFASTPRALGRIAGLFYLALVVAGVICPPVRTR